MGDEGPTSSDHHIKMIQQIYLEGTQAQLITSRNLSVCVCGVIQASSDQLENWPKMAYSSLCQKQLPSHLGHR